MLGISPCGAETNTLRTVQYPCMSLSSLHGLFGISVWIAYPFQLDGTQITIIFYLTNLFLDTSLCPLLSFQNFESSNSLILYIHLDMTSCHFFFWNISHFHSFISIPNLLQLV